MNHRERVVAALRHQEPDRLPVDLGGIDATSINGRAYQRLKDHLGVRGGRNRIHHPILDVAIVEDPVLEWAGADCKPVLIEGRAYRPGQMFDGTPCEYPVNWNPIPDADGTDVAVIDEAGTTLRRTPGAAFYFFARAPLADAETAADIERRAGEIEQYDAWNFWDRDWAEMEAEAKRLFETTDYLVTGNFSGHIFAGGEILRGHETFLLDLAENPALAQALMERITEHQIARFDRYVARVGPYVQVINVSDDLGGQQSGLISTRMYRELVKPYHARLFAHMKKNWDGFLLMHSDGAVAQYIPDLIEIGVDILNPVQYTAGGMDLAELKSRFGDSLSFWGGGCDTQQVLPFGSPADVRDAVRRSIDALAPGGGFVFSQVQIIPPETPPENLVAMYETVAELGAYGH
jgi:uroporphyrinogen decarboxylase